MSSASYGNHDDYLCSLYAVDIPIIQSTGLSDGAIAGIVVGVAVVAIAVIAVFVAVLIYTISSHGTKKPEAKATNEQ